MKSFLFWHILWQKVDKKELQRQRKYIISTLKTCHDMNSDEKTHFCNSAIFYKMADNVYNMSDCFALKKWIFPCQNCKEHCSYSVLYTHLTIHTTVIIQIFRITWENELSFSKYSISHQNLNGGRNFTHSSPSGQSPFVSSYLVQYTSGL